ncbi:MAG: nucleotidyltransferase domain-containing protein [Candidatus Omnitrophota bacterium]
MLDELFSSRARVEILKLFIFNPRDKFYQRQISLRSKQPIRAVQREVEKLEKIGLIKKSVTGNRIYYSIDSACPIYGELKGIIFKTAGIAQVLKAELDRSKKVIFAFIYGSYAEGKEGPLSDIDLMVIGNVLSRELSKILSKSKMELSREINYAVFKTAEFRNKVKEKDHFLSTVLKKKKIFIIGSENELKRFISSGQLKTP